MYQAAILVLALAGLVFCEDDAAPKKQEKRGIYSHGHGYGGHHGGGGHGGGHHGGCGAFGAAGCGLGGGGTGGGPTVTTIHQAVPVPQPVPVPYTITRAVPVPQPFPVPINVPRPVEVPVPVPQPVAVPRPVPYTITRPVPVPVAQEYSVCIKKIIRKQFRSVKLFFFNRYKKNTAKLNNHYFICFFIRNTCFLFYVRGSIIFPQ